MSFLQSLFSNDKMKDMAFSLVKKQMKENDVKYFVIELLDNGEIDLQPYHKEQEPVIMGKEQLNKLQGILDSMSGQVEVMSAENARLVEMCTEQEKTISRYQDKVGEIIDDEIELNNLKPIPDGSSTEAGQPV